ncbi:hypothetical protein Daus18300_009840 [Diaporthe australafricana]|uniref:BTB domain-containing protein n=1 Tax=Diaporthe australafricana TaxID=127596 RepID=A0ABR3WCU9_9PEZI
MDAITALWGEEKFSDATVIMGQKKWHIHRWLVCQRSDYFERALEGNFEASSYDLPLGANDTNCNIPFQESKDKTINLTGSPFTEEDVEDMLRYIYFQVLGKRQIKDPISAFVVADYFQVTSLCTIAAQQLTTGLDELVRKGYIIRFKEWCDLVLRKHKDTLLEQMVVKFLASRIHWAMHDSNAWDELTEAHPYLAKRIMQELFPKPVVEPRLKRPAGLAFDDVYSSRRDDLFGHRPGST